MLATYTESIGPCRVLVALTPNASKALRVTNTHANLIASLRYTLRCLHAVTTALTNPAGLDGPRDATLASGGPQVKRITVRTVSTIPLEESTV